MARTKTAAPISREPTVVQRTMWAILRVTSWIVIAWIAFVIPRVIITSAHTHASFTLQGWLLGFAVSLPIGAVEVAIAAAALSAMVFVPYAFIVWPNPHRTFVGERFPWFAGALAGVGLGAVIGVVTGFVAHSASSG